MRTHERVTISSALFFLAAVAASPGSSTAAEYKMSTPARSHSTPGTRRLTTIRTVPGNSRS